MTQDASSARVESGHSFRGSYSMHFQSSPVDAGVTTEGAITAWKDLSLWPAVWVRAFIYLVGPAAQMDLQLFSMSSVSGDALRFVIRPPNGAAVIATTFPSSSSTVSAIKVPRDRWVCLEWLIDTGTPNQVRVFLDGSEVPDLHLLQSTQPATNPLAHLKAEFAFFGSAVDLPAYDYYLDEIAIDKNQIGCDR
jgi:hypothetical protein